MGKTKSQVICVTLQVDQRLYLSLPAMENISRFYIQTENIKQASVQVVCLTWSEPLKQVFS